MQNVLPHIIYSIIMKSETISPIRPINKKFDILPNARNKTYKMN